MTIMKKKRLLSLAMLLTLLTQTVSCGTKAEMPADTQSSDTAATETEIVEETTEELFETDNLPEELDFAGETITVHVRGDEDTILEMYVESETGDTVDDAVYARNRVVEERLNVKLNTVYNDGWQGYNKTVKLLRSAIMAGDSTYDLIAGWSAQIPSLVMEGCFLNLKELPYLEFSRVWWNQSAVNSSTINDKLYLITGDISLSALIATYTVFYNKTIAQEYDMEDLYTCVFDGKWTIDKMATLTKQVYRDLNGNSERDDEDKYGFFAITGTNPDDGFMSGSLIHMLTQTDDGYYELNPEIDRVTTLAEKLYSLYFENEGTFNKGKTYPDGDEKGTELFKEDRVLFVLEYLGAIKDYGLNDMTSDFGILPYPKLEETQESYGTYIQNAVSLWGIPTSCADPERAAAVLEALCSESYRHITPAYYETALKVKYSRDNESVQMLDLIKSCGQLDFEIMYNESIGSVRYIMRNLMNAERKDVASFYATKQKTYEAAVNKVMDYFRNTES